MRETVYVSSKSVHCFQYLRRWHSCIHSESFKCNGNDRAQQFHFFLWFGCSGSHGDCPEDQYGSYVCGIGTFSGTDAFNQLQLRQRKYSPHEKSSAVCHGYFCYFFNNHYSRLLPWVGFFHPPVYEK